MMLRDQIQRLESAAHLNRDPDDYCALARMYHRQGEDLKMLRALRRWLAVDLSEATRLRVRALVEKRESALEPETSFETVEVSSREYRKIFDRFEATGDKAGSGAWAQSHAYSSDVVELPRSPRRRAVIFHHLLLFFEDTWIYTGEELMAMLRDAIAAFSIDTDYCHLRRYMMGLRMFRRSIDGSLYWVNPNSPLKIAG